MGSTQEAQVVRVVDGDTIRVQIGGHEFRVRYIGIDTPETVHPTQPVEWMGREASAANKSLVEGRTVVLETDVSETDQYGRLLRYVWVDDGAGWLLVNRELVRLGFAQAFTYPPDVMYADLFLEAQQRARDAGRGLWGEPPPEDPPQEPPANDNGGNGGDGGTEACDPSYPGVCIPPAPPDLDCGDISERDFKVRGADPHRFDGDDDGLGCESGGGNGGGGGGGDDAGGGGGSCHRSYPGVCIPPAPPDLDCGDVPFRDFRVRGADPHGFDGDGDGYGCES